MGTVRGLEVVRLRGLPVTLITDFGVHNFSRGGQSLPLQNLKDRALRYTRYFTLFPEQEQAQKVQKVVLKMSDFVDD
jgi:hypothetical protein